MQKSKLAPFTLPLLAFTLTLLSVYSKFMWNAEGSWPHSSTWSYSELYPQENSMGRGSCLEITHAASLKDCLGKSKEAKITSHPSSYVYLPDPSCQDGRDWSKRKKWGRLDFPWLFCFQWDSKGEKPWKICSHSHGSSRNVRQREINSWGPPRVK